MNYNYNIRMFRNALVSYVKQSTLEPEVKLLALKELITDVEKEADAVVIREAAELEKASQLKAADEKKAVENESEEKHKT